MDVFEEIKQANAEIGITIRRLNMLQQKVDQKLGFLTQNRLVPLNIAANMVAKTPRTIQNWIGTGKLTPYLKSGKKKLDNTKTHIYIDVSELYEVHHD